MASPVEAVLESPLESALDPSLVGADEGLVLEEFGDVRRDEVPWELDRGLQALCRERGPLRAVVATADTAVRPPWRGDGADTARPIPSPPHPSLPPALMPLLGRLEEADAFGLDERLRCALSMEQRLEARIGPLLALVWERWVHRALGYTTREVYARERLGMDPTRARALVRLERAAVRSEPFARTYRSGALSWLKASVLAPLVSADPLGWFVEDWVAWAGRVTVRRLGAMLDHALSSWGALDGKVAARHKVFARDGWRCAVPGCTSMQNLHDHHIRLRSAGGPDVPENRITLCAFHHLRGVHAGLLRCVGRAPDGLRWEMGIRHGVTPLLSYRSGDLRVPAMAPQFSSP